MGGNSGENSEGGGRTGQTRTKPKAMTTEGREWGGGVGGVKTKWRHGKGENEQRKKRGPQGEEVSRKEGRGKGRKGGKVARPDVNQAGFSYKGEGGANKNAFVIGGRASKIGGENCSES